MQETWVRSLGQEDPLEEEMATHSSILAWKIPRRERPSGLQPMGSQRVRHNLATEQCKHFTMSKTFLMGEIWTQGNHIEGKVQRYEKRPFNNMGG